MDSRYCGSASLSSVPLFLFFLLSSLCYFSSGIFGSNLARCRCVVGSSHRMVKRILGLRPLRHAKILRLSPNASSPFPIGSTWKHVLPSALLDFFVAFACITMSAPPRAGLQSGLRDRRWLSFTFSMPFALCLVMECPQFFVTLFSFSCHSLSWGGVRSAMIGERMLSQGIPHDSLSLF